MIVPYHYLWYDISKVYHISLFKAFEFSVCLDSGEYRGLVSGTQLESPVVYGEIKRHHLSLEIEKYYIFQDTNEYNIQCRLSVINGTNL